MKYVATLVVIVTAGPIVSSVALAHPASFKLFDATETFSTGPNVSPSNAILFGSITLSLPVGRPVTRAVISSTPDGTGPIVIDNFMTINRIVNICENVAGQEFPDSCFGTILQDPVAGLQIETVLTPIPPIDVTADVNAALLGAGEVVFELRDFGTIAGNTDLFLFIEFDSTPPGPDLVAVTECVGLGSLLVSARNIGGDTSGATSAFIALDRVTEGESTSLFAGSFGVPSLAPQGQAELTTLATGDCPQEENNRCDLFVSVDDVATSQECRQQQPPKLGVVCEADEANNTVLGFAPRCD